MGQEEPQLPRSYALRVLLDECGGAAGIPSPMHHHAQLTKDFKQEEPCFRLRSGPDTDRT
jgi:hypothetical protein